MKKLILFSLLVILFAMTMSFTNSHSYAAQAAPMSISPSAKDDMQVKTISDLPNESTSSAYFSMGMGGTDVIPHQLVRTNTDHLYIFVNQQSSAVLRVYRTTGTGIPENASAFAAPIQLTEISNLISVDAVYDGGSIVHVLINMQNGHIKDYPFNVATNAFNAPITLATNGGYVSSGLYVGTSGMAGMVDLNGKLQVTYWKNDNHIFHRAYTYNSAINTLTPAGDFVQVDTAGGANHPAVAISPFNNSLTVAWVSQVDNPPKIRTRTRTSDGTWSSVQNASSAAVWTSTDNGINIDQGPSLVIDMSGTKHLTYIQSFDGSVGDYGRIHYVTDNGSGWVDEALNAFTHDPALALNSTGEVYIIGHGHPKNPTCLSMLDMCTIKKSTTGTWGTPQLFALHPNGSSFDSSPSVKWSVVGFNRPDVIEFVFFKTPYDSPVLYYGQIQSISQAITITGTAGTAGVKLSYIDGTAKTTSSLQDGGYSLQVPDNWSGTVTPTHACYTFTPANRVYNNVTTNQTVQNYTPAFNAASSCANIGVDIGGVNRGTYGVPVQGSQRVSYALDAGPVKVASTNGVPLIAALRDAWKLNGQVQSFAQLMGLPQEQLSDTYLFPAYNNITLDEQIRFANVDSIATTVTVTIAGIPRGTYTLAPNEGKRVTYALDAGPVEVKSSGAKIIAAIRDAWKVNGQVTSFVQVMGLPKESLSDTYLFPAYNNVTLDGQLRFGNVDTIPTTITVTIAGVPRGTYNLAPSESQRVSYALDAGPVEIKSSNGAKIIAALRDAWKVNGQVRSFAQLMGLPKEQLSDTYILPAYNNLTLDGQLRFGNVDTIATTVTVKIAGVIRGTYNLNPSQSQRVSYALDSGPVEISTSNGAKIIVAIRDAWKVNGQVTSFVQMMGLPKELLSSTYWFPAYNNITLDGQLRFGVP